MESVLRRIKKFIPKRVFTFFQPAYHFLLALAGALLYRFPARKLTVIAVTGTKGKSTTVELIGTILNEAGITHALLSTIHFKIAQKETKNLFKMTLPGRFFVQKFLRDAVASGCTHVVIEMTSEGAVQFRHAYTYPDILIFTNLEKEHIESHGSFENYVAAKLKLVRALERSPKAYKTVIANTDDRHAKKFLSAAVDNSISYSLADAKPYFLSEERITFTYRGESVTAPLVGTFNIYNALAALSLADVLGIERDSAIAALKHMDPIAGRVEAVDLGQPFRVIVDYAHTPGSLEQLYKAFKEKNKICVLGNTGGGRDTWKRKDMGAIADTHCSQIILTNEDPYDEDPMAILNDMRAGITSHPPLIILDRREAIRRALTLARSGDVVLISGKGTDPYIMGKNGSKIPWSDTGVVREELKKLRTARKAT